MQFLNDNKEWIIPLVLYIALNVARRDYLVKNESPVIRGLASALERVLFLEWDRWGGKFKAIGIVSPGIDSKDGE